MSEPGGRRERKKELTRQAILQAAKGLFAERGFHAVTIAEVAEAADVAQQTIFNHFRTKEDLFFGKLDEAAADPVSAVLARPPGESVTGALRRHVADNLPGFWTAEAAPRKLAWLRVLADTPSLQARERELQQACEDLLADALRAELPGVDGRLLARLIASQYVAAKRAITGELRRRLLAGEPPEAVAADIPRLVHHVFDRLECGLAGVGVRAGPLPEPAPPEPAAPGRAARDHAPRDHAPRDHAPRDHAPRDHALPEPAVPERAVARAR